MTSLRLTGTNTLSLHAETCASALPSAAQLPAPGWRALADRFIRRRTLRKLYRLSPRLLRDIGIDPAEVYGAFEGRLSEIHGDRWRGL